MKKIHPYKTTFSTALLQFFLICSLLSCKKFLEVGSPKMQLPAEKVFQNDALVEAAVANLYTSTISFGAGGLNSVTIAGARSADETQNYSTNTSVIELANNQLLAANAYTTSIWTTSYQCIYNSNTLLQGLEDNPHISAKLKNRAMGEAYFFRAFAHLNLANLYDRVPLIITTDYRSNTTARQSSYAQVLQQVVLDLQQAQQLLPEDYQPYNNERLRLNRYAAKALLARTYLYLGQYDQAEAYSSEVIDQSTLYQLQALNNVFLKNSKEAIFQLRSNSTTLNTSDGNIFILTGRPTQMALRSAFYQSFGNTDLRKTTWIGKYTTGGLDYYYPHKYKVKTGATLTEYSMVLRLAEQYLIRAEARTKGGDLAGAIEDLDQIRQRAGLAKLATISPHIDQTQLLEEVLQQRKLELFTEWAHRWIDLKRKGKLDEVLSPVKPTWRSTAQHFPIPQYEMTINKNLKQHEGY